MRINCNEGYVEIRDDMMQRFNPACPADGDCNDFDISHYFKNEPVT
jgi:hypothetical protein